MKLLLEKKEAELEQLRSGNARTVISPVRISRCNITSSLRPDDNKLPEVSPKVIWGNGSKRARVKTGLS